MGTVRQSRTGRRQEPGPVRLQDRDRWLLEALGKMRFLTTRQLARLYFGGSRWAVNKRLRKLLDAGLVKAWVRDLARENVYSLDRAGVCLLGDGSTDPVPAAPRGLDGNLDHLLAINDVRISLAAGLEETGGEIRWWRSDWELRAEARARLIPDALFAIWWQGQEQTFALEVDNETRSLRTLLGKILRYGSAQHARGSLQGAVILLVARHPQLADRYRESLASTLPRSRVFIAPLEAVEREGAPGRIWRALGEGRLYSLRDLVSLPSGKEGMVSASTYGTRS